MITLPNLNLTDKLNALVTAHEDTVFYVRKYVFGQANELTYEIIITQQLTPLTMAQMALAGLDKVKTRTTPTLSVCRKLIDKMFTVAMTADLSTNLKLDLHVYTDWAPGITLADRAVHSNMLVSVAKSVALAPLLTPQATELVQLADAFADAFIAADYTDRDVTVLHDYLQLRNENVKWRTSA